MRGRCLSYGEGITFWPIRSVVFEAAGLTGEESPQTAREKIRGAAQAAPDADLIVDRVTEAIGITDSVPGQRGVAWAIGRFFEELAKRGPRLLHDIHWESRSFSTSSKQSPRRQELRRSYCSAWRDPSCSSCVLPGGNERTRPSCRSHH